MNLLYFYLFLCQGNIRHILYASVKTARLKLSKEQTEQRCLTPLRHVSPFSVCLDSVVYDLRDGDIESDTTHTRRHTRTWSQVQRTQVKDKQSSTQLRRQTLKISASH